MDQSTALPADDLQVLRRLAETKVQLAHAPANRERREAWYNLDAGRDHRPMILAEFFDIRDKVRPLSPDKLECVDPWARKLEMSMRAEIYHAEVLRDDYVIEPWINTNWKVDPGDWGVEIVVHQGGDEEHMGSRTWESPIKDLDADFDKLKHRRPSVDRDATAAEKQRLEQVFDGICPVRIRGAFYWTMGLTWTAIDLIGLENLMISMYDNPDGLHRVMGFLRDDNHAMIDWLEAEGLYSLNNENDGIGSGSLGYTRDLPQADRHADQPVRAKDLWVLSESQETVGASPDMFEQFVFPYQKSITDRFGKVYYGCCEPLDKRWHVVRQMPNLARASISPWADEEFMAKALGGDYVYSRKPKPTLISTTNFDQDAIRHDLRSTLALTNANGCRVEIIMKDLHTLNNQPERLARWVEIAREEANAASRP